LFGTTTGPSPNRDARLSDNFAGVGPVLNPSSPFVFTGINSATDAMIYQNTTRIADKRAPLATRDLTSGYEIGAQGYLTSEDWIGDMAEILVYNRALAPTEQQAVESALQVKYISPVTTVVTPAALTITANNRSKTYGQAVTFAGTEFTPTGLVNGDHVTSVTLASAGAASSASVAGSPYAIVPSAAVGTGLTNYAITYVNGSLAVNPAPTNTRLGSSGSPSLYGQSVTFTATPNSNTNQVSGGTVTFQDGTTILASNVPLNGSGSETFSTSSLAAGVHTITATYNGAPNYVNSSSSLTQRVNRPPSITSAGSATFTAGQANSFTITTGPDYPTATTLTETGNLPNGVTFHDNGNGTATLSGNPAPGTGGPYTLTITAANGVAPNATQTFLLGVEAPPWYGAAAMSAARIAPTATRLANGKLLVTGGSDNISGLLSSAELYDPASNTWSAASPLSTARSFPTATLLASGKVLLTGGGGTSSYLASAELYDPASNTWSAASPMSTARYGQTATLLPNGKVLVAAGYGGSSFLTSAELYDAAGNAWSPAGSMMIGRYFATATLLANGKVLVAGGRGDSDFLASAELYDPAANTWSPAAPMSIARYGHTATLLANGKVLVAGGGNSSGSLASAELYDPGSNTWSPAASLNTARGNQAATLLADGKVLVTGGANGSVILATAEVYDPGRNTWSTSFMSTPRNENTATLLANGNVLITGGYRDTAGTALSSSELYEPGTAPTFTSVNSAIFTVGSAGSFSVTTTGGSPTPITLTESGALPGGVTFVDQGNGTARLSGTPAAGSGGPYTLTITAANNGNSATSTQVFTLTVNEAPAITSANTTTFTVGAAGSFTVTTGHDFPAATTLSESGALPAGVTFTDNHNGTATLAGTPSGAAGTFPLRITASNGVAPDATQSFTLVVNPGAAANLVLSGLPASATAGASYAVTLTTTDAYGNVATGYAGTVHFTSTDPLASLPGNYTFTTADAGTHTFTVMLRTAGTQAVTATDTVNATLTAGATAVVSEPVFFGPATSYPVGRVPEAVAVGDFNGDGILDLAVVNGADNTVSILLGNGDGTFQAPLTCPAGDGPVSVVAVDLTGTGILDLVVADLRGNYVSVLLGNGDGTFQAPQSYATGQSPIEVAVADLNGDGIPDLVTANYDDGTVSILLGVGDGAFQPAQNIPAGSKPAAVVVADFNGDGIPDLAVADFAGNSVNILLGNGDGTFQMAAAYAVAAGPVAVAVGDFNGDGIPDLVVACQYANAVSVLFGNGDGSFGNAQVYNAGPSPAWVAVGDIDGDGLPDLVVSDYGANQVVVLPGNPDGTFRPPVSYAVGTQPLGGALADFNGDGFLDVAVADAGDNTVSVLLNPAGAPNTHAGHGLGAGIVPPDVTDAALIAVVGRGTAGVPTMIGSFTRIPEAVPNPTVGSFDDGVSEPRDHGRMAAPDDSRSVRLRDRFFALDGDTDQFLAWGGARGDFATMDPPDLGVGFDPALVAAL
jgi:hypothetical protein